MTGRKNMHSNSNYYHSGRLLQKPNKNWRWYYGTTIWAFLSSHHNLNHHCILCITRKRAKSLRIRSLRQWARTTQLLLGMLQRWRAEDKKESDLAGSNFEFQTSHSRNQRVIPQPIDRLKPLKNFEIASRCDNILNLDALSWKRCAKRCYRRQRTRLLVLR